MADTIKTAENAVPSILDIRGLQKSFGCRTSLSP